MYETIAIVAKSTAFPGKVGKTTSLPLLIQSPFISAYNGIQSQQVVNKSPSTHSVQHADWACYRSCQLKNAGWWGPGEVPSLPFGTFSFQRSG